MPDTIWFPENAYRLPLERDDADVNLVLFPVVDPSAFDAVVCDAQDYVVKVEVKQADAHSHWIWGAITTTGSAFHALRSLWESRHRCDEYLGSLLNAYIARRESRYAAITWARATWTSEPWKAIGRHRTSCAPGKPHKAR